MDHLSENWFCFVDSLLIVAPIFVGFVFGSCVNYLVSVQVLQSSH